MVPPFPCVVQAARNSALTACSCLNCTKYRLLQFRCTEPYFHRRSNTNNRPVDAWTNAVLHVQHSPQSFHERGNVI